MKSELVAIMAEIAQVQAEVSAMQAENSDRESKGLLTGAVITLVCAWVLV